MTIWNNLWKNLSLETRYEMKRLMDYPNGKQVVMEYCSQDVGAVVWKEKKHDHFFPNCFYKIVDKIVKP